LHKAVEFENGSWEGNAVTSSSHDGNGNGNDNEEEMRFPIVGILLDAGCDPRIRSRGGRKAVDLVDARNEALRGFLRRAEVLLVEGERVVGDLERGEDGDGYGVDGGVGSGSDEEVVIR